MNNIDFRVMNKKRRDLYECMWGSNAFDFPVMKTRYRDSVSNNSYTFTNTSTINEDICMNRLADLFRIQCRDTFAAKFAQSCGGSGQELKRIAVLHSSSLCALLFFYNVSKENPYIMEIEGEEYIFTYSCFEYQNAVIEGRNPSNMDVVLVGSEKKTGREVVLFLESKFSEYYERTGQQLEIASAYLDNKYGKALYDEAILTNMGLKMITCDGNDTFVLCSEETCYLEGIKQMISHYIGIRNLCVTADQRDDAVAYAVSNGAKVLLGEILFTKGIGQLRVGNDLECLASYKKQYILLADILNAQLKADGISEKFTVLSKTLSYSQFQDKEYIQESQIKRFYFELGKQDHLRGSQKYKSGGNLP